MYVTKYVYLSNGELHKIVADRMNGRMWVMPDLLKDCFIFFFSPLALPLLANAQLRGLSFTGLFISIF